MSNVEPAGPRAAEVVITGIGLVTPLGATAAESTAAWRAGHRARRATLSELAGTRLEKAPVAVLPDLDPAARLGGRRMLKYMSDAAVLGSLAAREAVQEAELRTRFAPEAIGLYAATGLAAARVSDVLPLIENSIDAEGRFSCELLGKRGLAATHPLLSFRVLANTAPCLVSIMETIRGPNCLFTPWEGQGAGAIVEAWRAVETGECAAAVVGAADSPAHPSSFVFLRQSGLLQDTELPASAGAYMVFERLETARRDDRSCYASIRSLGLEPTDGAAEDPLAEQLGRTFAAAPAALLALAAGSLACDDVQEQATTLIGVDKQRFSFHLESTSCHGLR